jgi:hypothetical protein
MPERRAPRGRRHDDEKAAKQQRDEPEPDEPESDELEADEAEADELEPDEPETDEPEPDRQPGRKRGSGNSGNGGLSAAQAAKIGLREIAELTGKQPEGVTGVELGEDSWVVGVEVVEDSRVPSSADILATYEAEVDADGELMSYRRVRRYARGRGEES